MTEIIICSLTALLASLLTLFSGFGLGTILTPVFALFYPIEIAIALTGIVHLLNNIFKLTLLGNKANKNIVLKFGIPSILGAFIGAFVLIQLSKITITYSYQIAEYTFTTTPIKIVLAVLILFFVLMEIVPALYKLEFGEKHLLAGGLVSGFFGGLSGNQGALRSAFLIKLNLDKQIYIATGVVIACMVDFTRIPMYLKSMDATLLSNNYAILISSILSAFAGAFIGSKLLKKITVKTIQIIVSILLTIISICLGAGII